MDELRQDLASLSRRDLQKLAKQHGVKANVKSSDIVEELCTTPEVAASVGRLRRSTPDTEGSTPSLLSSSRKPFFTRSASRASTPDAGPHSDQRTAEAPSTTHGSHAATTNNTQQQQQQLECMQAAGDGSESPSAALHPHKATSPPSAKQRFVRPRASPPLPPTLPSHQQQQQQQRQQQNDQQPQLQAEGSLPDYAPRHSQPNTKASSSTLSTLQDKANRLASGLAARMRGLRLSPTAKPADSPTGMAQAAPAAALGTAATPVTAAVPAAGAMPAAGRAHAAEHIRAAAQPPEVATRAAGAASAAQAAKPAMQAHGPPATTSLGAVTAPAAAALNTAATSAAGMPGRRTATTDIPGRRAAAAPEATGIAGATEASGRPAAAAAAAGMPGRSPGVTGRSPGGTQGCSVSAARAPARMITSASTASRSVSAARTPVRSGSSSGSKGQIAAAAGAGVAHQKPWQQLQHQPPPQQQQKQQQQEMATPPVQRSVRFAASPPLTPTATLPAVTAPAATPRAAMISVATEWPLEDPSPTSDATDTTPEPSQQQQEQQQGASWPPAITPARRAALAALTTPLRTPMPDGSLTSRTAAAAAAAAAAAGEQGGGGAMGTAPAASVFATPLRVPVRPAEATDNIAGVARGMGAAAPAAAVLATPLRVPNRAAAAVAAGDGGGAHGAIKGAKGVGREINGAMQPKTPMGSAARVATTASRTGTKQHRRPGMSPQPPGSTRQPMATAAIPKMPTAATPLAKPARRIAPAPEAKERSDEQRRLERVVERELMRPAGTGPKFAALQGLQRQKQLLRESIIHPCKQQHQQQRTATQQAAKSGNSSGSSGGSALRSLLLFGPSGCGKTQLARALSAEMGSPLLYVPASELLARHQAAGRDIIRAIFAVAARQVPVVVVFDDAHLVFPKQGLVGGAVTGGRAADAHAAMHAMQQMKTELMVQCEQLAQGTGATVSSSSTDAGGSATAAAGSSTPWGGSSRHQQQPGGQGSAKPQTPVVVVLASHSPELLDDSIRRCMGLRVQLGLPGPDEREALIFAAMVEADAALSVADVEQLVRDTEGHSCHDIVELCREATMGPTRELMARSVAMRDFEVAFLIVQPSVEEARAQQLHAWGQQYGAL